MRLEVKSLELPVDMIRALAAEAEADRQARARRVLASGEERAAKILREAAKNLEGSAGPGAVQLRYLQTMNDISAEDTNIVVLPMPVNLLHALFTS